MHKSSYDKMGKFVENHLKEDQAYKIIDIGSQDVNGSYKPLFEKKNWKYDGCDMVEGKNVNIILNDIYNWKDIKTNSYDVVISGQAFEHVEYFWVTMFEVARILKPGGICCIIAPSRGFEHKYPVDCWRFYPDGFRALARYAYLDTLEAYTQWESGEYEDGSDTWGDSVLIARKPNLLLKDRFIFRIKNYLLKNTIRR